MPTRSKTSQPSKQAASRRSRPSAHADAPDPIAMLKEDHTKVKGLFDEFESARTARSKQRIARDAIMELDVHAGIEEEIFYPAFQAESEAEETQEITLEAEEEHHVVHVLIAELKEMLGSDDPRFDAKFTVLAENVRHHIKEEETQMLPKAKKLGKERLMELGAEMQQRREELRRQFKEEMSRT
ncbi:MAG: hemerythrin domain-containing protein [Dehalococcoidia bacterium]